MPKWLFGPGNVERHEEHRAKTPAQVLRVAAGLLFDRQRLSSERVRFGEEQLAQLLQALDRVEVAGNQLPAVGPFVVANDVEQRHRRRVE
jgi:hypothetical protein